MGKSLPRLLERWPSRRALAHHSRGAPRPIAARQGAPRVPRDVMNPAPRDAQNLQLICADFFFWVSARERTNNACGIRITPEGHGTGKDCAV